MAFSIVLPSLPDGTPIYDVTAGGHSRLGVSIDWNTRLRPGGHEGCPSWINEIVVADDATAARKAAPLQQLPIASSSRSSRGVVVHFVDENGQPVKTEGIPFLFVPVVHGSNQIGTDGEPLPIADEIWFSFEPITGGLITTVEHQCNKPGSKF